MNAYVTRTIFPVFAFIVTHRVILFTRFCTLLTRVATLSGGGGGGTWLKCLNGTTPLTIVGLATFCFVFPRFI